MAAIRLYGTPLSPYFCRVWFAALAKGLDLDLVIGPPDVASDPNRARAPLGKIPFIEDGDLLLYESEVICEYLEDRHPSPPLLPADPAARARSRLVSRLVDLYLLAPVHALAPQIRVPQRDEAYVGAQLARVRSALALLDQSIQPAPWCLGLSPQLADCALVPALWYLPQILRHFTGGEDVRRGYDRLTPYWDLAQTAPLFAAAFTAMDGARADFMATLRARYGDKA